MTCRQVCTLGAESDPDPYNPQHAEDISSVSLTTLPATHQHTYTAPTHTSGTGAMDCMMQRTSGGVVVVPLPPPATAPIMRPTAPPAVRNTGLSGIGVQAEHTITSRRPVAQHATGAIRRSRRAVSKSDHQVMHRPLDPRLALDRPLLHPYSSLIPPHATLVFPFCLFGAAACQTHSGFCMV